MFLAVSITINLLILGFFKYYNFFALSFNELTQNFGFNIEAPWLDVVLPVGISFFTFQAMSYVIDVYRGDAKASSSPLDILLYISFFPQLVAGPIVRSSDFLWQLEKAPDKNRIRFDDAVILIIGGLFKKSIIANYIAVQIVDPVFSDPSAYSSVDLLFGVYGYAVQIYCDFSAYSDIAIGIAYLLGYQFPINFNFPYKSLSLQEFWRRWHISLSTWLRNYLYIPLGGSRRGNFKTYRNLAVTMLLGGLWHGAAWNFIFWGGLHGFWLAVERFFKERGFFKNAFYPFKILYGIFIFHFVCLSWIFFRADSFETAAQYINGISTLTLEYKIITPFVLTLIILGLALNLVPDKIRERVRNYYYSVPFAAKVVFAALALLIVSVMSPEGTAPFIYFQF